MPRGWIAGLGAALAACAAACGSPDERSPDGVETPLASSEHRVVLGTGEADFEPMNAEPHLRLVAGVQGGFHVWASFLAYGFVSDRVDMLLETTVDDDAAKRLTMRARISLRDAADAEGELAQAFAGFPAQVFDARCAHDRRVGVAVTLTDTNGASATDVRHCIAEVDETQRRSDCE